jgi:3,2-trans-enoyl-CoA isomerase
MLKVTDHDGVRELRLDRPPANALRADLLIGLRSALEVAPAEGAGAVVLSGAPGFFSAGLDVPHLMQREYGEAMATFEALFALMRALCTSPVPVVAALTGHATAGGAVIALFCDYRVMAEGRFKVGLNEVQVGLPIPRVILAALERLVGPRAAERLCVEARLVDPREAERLGLVDRVVPAADVVLASLEWCKEVLALPPTAMNRTRMLARSQLLPAFEELAGVVPPEFSETWASEETQAAMHALVERLKSRQ